MKEKPKTKCCKVEYRIEERGVSQLSFDPHFFCSKCGKEDTEVKADEFNYDGILKEGQSFNRNKETSTMAQESPGAANIISTQKEEVISKTVTINSSPPKNEIANPPKRGIGFL